MSFMTATQPERDVIAEINQIRLDEDLSYEALAQRVGITTKTLHRVITRRERNPYDRTLHKIRKFLDARAAAQPKRGARQQAGA